MCRGGPSANVPPTPPFGCGGAWRSYDARMAVWAVDVRVGDHVTRIVSSPWWTVVAAVALVLTLATVVTLGLIWMRQRRRSSGAAGLLRSGQPGAGSG